MPLIKLPDGNSIEFPNNVTGLEVAEKISKSLSKQATVISVDNELKDLSYIIDKDCNIKTVYCTYDPDTLGKNPSDGRKVKGVIHFVESSKAISAEFRIYDRLFLDPNPAKFDDLSSSINPKSLEIKNGFVEPNLSDAKTEFAYQFEREGYFCRDSESDGLVFNKTVGLRDTWNQ